MKTELVQIRIDAEFKNRLKAAADQDGRSLSNYILRILREKLDQ